MTRTIALIIAALLATPAVAADQFDLICTAEKEPKPVRYIVDLATGEWCNGQCVEVQKIKDVTSTTITFVKTTPAYAGALAHWQYVNRVTGAWHFSILDRRVTIIIEGTCTPAPFTGFGADRAKF